MAQPEQRAHPEYLLVLRRRKLIVAIVLIVATASAAFFSSRQAHLYQASSQVYLNPTAQLTGGAGGAAADAQARYLATEASLAHTPEIAGLAVARAGSTSTTSSRLLSESSVSANASTNILTFSVTNRDRHTAVRLVNAYVSAFAVDSEKADVGNIVRAIDSLNGRVRALNRQIDAAKAAGTHPAAARSQLASLLKERERLVQLKLIQPTAARISAYATGAPQIQPNTKRTVGIGAALGLVLGVFLAFLREGMDTRVRSSEEVNRALGIGLLARIPRPSRSLRSESRLALLTETPDDESEPYRKLRVAVDFANLRAKADCILMMSAFEQEGKSTTAANLALALALAGRHVTLVDTDLRRPMQHRFFGLPLGPGLTDVVLGAVALEAALRQIDVPGARGGRAFPDVRAPTARGRLTVVTAGTLPPDPAEFLESDGFKHLVDDLRRSGGVVLLDSPPVVAVSDAMTLSRVADAIVVCVDLTQSRKAGLAELRRLLDVCTAPKLGYCLTGVEKESGYGYGYSGAQAEQESSNDPARPGRQPAPRQA